MEVHVSELVSRLLILLRHYLLLVLFGFTSSFVLLRALDFKEHLDVRVLFSAVRNDRITEEQLSLFGLPDL